jgi:hypothetical protein
MDVFSMNGPDSPGFPLPTWTLVNESHLWTHGLPDCITLVHNPDVCAGEGSVGVFATREAAQDFIDRTSLPGVRPCSINRLVVFIALLNSMIQNGLKHAVRYCPERPGSLFWECDADKLLKLLTDAAKAGKG